MGHEEFTQIALARGLMADDGKLVTHQPRRPLWNVQPRYPSRGRITPQLLASRRGHEILGRSILDKGMMQTEETAVIEPKIGATWNRFLFIYGGAVSQEFLD